MFAKLTLKNYPLPPGEGLARFSLPKRLRISELFPSPMGEGARRAGEGLPFGKNQGRSKERFLKNPQSYLKNSSKDFSGTILNPQPSSISKFPDKILVS